MTKVNAILTGCLCNSGLVWLTAYMSIMAALSLKNLTMQQIHEMTPRTGKMMKMSIVSPKLLVSSA